MADQISLEPPVPINSYHPYHFYYKLINQSFEMDIKAPEQTTKLCISCNTFYGNAASQWLCSTCYKNTHKETIASKATSPVSQKITYPKIQEKEKQSETVEQKDRTRCFKCSKRVGLLGIECKCDFVFCNLHRLPESHECKIDYKKIGHDKLTKDNKVVAASKITEI